MTVVLNACESASQRHGTSSNIAASFLQHGVSNVVGMSYKLLLSAAEIFVGTFYKSVCRPNVSVSEAALHARRILGSMRSRKARFQMRVSVDDFIVPAIYQNESSVNVLSPEVTQMLLEETTAEDRRSSVHEAESDDREPLPQSKSQESNLKQNNEMVFGRSFDLSFSTLR